MLTKETHNTGNVWTHHFPRHHLLAACGISLAATLLLAVLPDSVVAYRVQELEPSPAPAVAPAIETPAAEITTAPVEIDPWLHLTVRKGDTL